MNVLIVGVGLIGGSFSLALKKNEGLNFAGFDQNKAYLSKACDLGIVDQTFDNLSEGIDWADFVVLAIPVKGIKILLPKILDQLAPHQFVVDFGSTKKSICLAVDGHSKRNQFIAAHPIAGTEHSGPEAAFEDLFKGKNLILCDTEKSASDKLSIFEELSIQAGFYLTKMSASEHDRHLAYISHLSHITSYVLSQTVLNKEKDGEVILDLAGSGFESTVRLAKSSPAMWSSIFLENKEMVLRGIEAYKTELTRLEDMIKSDAENDMFQYLEEGRRIRKILK